MIKSLRLMFVSVIAVGCLALVSFAQEGDKHPPNINQRQENQKDRIKDGVKDGDINKKELGRLALEQRQIRRKEERFKSDGDFTKGERARVQRQLGQSSRHITRAKRN
jgi:hypothetical protein